MKKICEPSACTGCAACQQACPTHCITMQADTLGSMHPVIGTECIDCDLCRKICPNNSSIRLTHPIACYAAWSLNTEHRKGSASGGVANELYRYFFKNGGRIFGVVYERSKGAYFKELLTVEDLLMSLNSKYVFSSTSNVFSEIKAYLSDGERVLFIGVPCQIAGLYAFLRKHYDNLITVDLICHGFAPNAYLEQHIESKEGYKNTASVVSFRDPRYFTYTFTFTLKNAFGREFYKKRVRSLDNYQLGYHKALIYRENCYSCRYARAERIGDLTIGDFSGLGRLAPCDYSPRKVSCVLANTLKGIKLIEAMVPIIHLDLRPIDEALRFEHQLQHPSIPHKNRGIFVDSYVKTGSFRKAANRALLGEKLGVIIHKGYLKTDFKSMVYKFMPKSLIGWLRHIDKDSRRSK